MHVLGPDGFVAVRHQNHSRDGRQFGKNILSKDNLRNFKKRNTVLSSKYISLDRQTSIDEKPSIETMPTKSLENSGFMKSITIKDEKMKVKKGKKQGMKGDGQDFIFNVSKPNWLLC